MEKGLLIVDKSDVQTNEYGKKWCVVEVGGGMEGDTKALIRGSGSDLVVGERLDPKYKLFRGQLTKPMPIFEGKGDKRKKVREVLKTSFIYNSETHTPFTHGAWAGVSVLVDSVAKEATILDEVAEEEPALDS